MTNRRRNWKNDLFLKFGVALAVGFIIASYNSLSDYMLSSSVIHGEMKAFKEVTEKKLKKFGDEQANRTGNVEYSGKLKNGDARSIKHLCESILLEKCK